MRRNLLTSKIIWKISEARNEIYYHKNKINSVKKAKEKGRKNNKKQIGNAYYVTQ